MNTELFNDIKDAKGQGCLRLVTSEEPRNTFIGGMPKASGNIIWPRRNEMALGFIGQLDLGEINTRGDISWLPEKGRLLFFYDLEEWPWGFDPNDKGGWAVILDNGEGDIINVEPPKDLNSEFQAPNIKYLKAVTRISLPGPERIDIESLGFTDQDEEDYYEYLSDSYEGNSHHQISGFPDPVQNDSMEEECQLVSGGINCGGSDSVDKAKVKELQEQENDWKLLFQFDSDDDIDAMWGDSGMLYFWVREKDARSGDFTDVWMILQCC